MFASIGWEFQYTVYTPILLAAAAVMATIGGYAWRNRDVTGATWFAALMAGATVWAVCYAFQLAGANEATIRFWADLNHVGVAVVPIAWFGFALQLSVRDHWLTRRTLAGLSVLPVVYLGLVATNGVHHLVREPIDPEPVADGALIVSQHAFGPAFWIHSLYGYGLMLAGVVMLGHLLVWAPNVYRRQVSLLVFGALAAAATNAVYHAGLSPLPYLDLTAFSFTISGVVFFVAIYHYRLFDLTPVARSFVVDTLHDGIVVLDRNDRVVDINGTAEELLAVPDDGAIGRQFDSLLPSTAEPTGESLATEPNERSKTTDLPGEANAFTESTDTMTAASETTGRGSGTNTTGVGTSTASSPIPTDDTATFASYASTTTPHTATARDDGGDHRGTQRGTNEGNDGGFVTELVVGSGSGRRFLQLSSDPVVDLGGEPLGRSVVVRDVTETRELQAAVDETLDRLHRSNEELESFATVVSHDLRQPLRSAEQHLSMFEDAHGDQLEGDGAELVRIARENARRGQEMTADLLEYSKIGHDVDEFDDVDCEAVVTAVLDGLRVDLDERNATVEVGALPTVRGVRHLLYRLFQNLLSNALEYAGEDPPRVTVTARRRSDCWQFAVRDEGVGIEPERVDRVFDLFARGDRTESSGGTGVGLAICEKIVAVHGGTITIDSTPGEGTAVEFTIPDDPGSDCDGDG